MNSINEKFDILWKKIDERLIKQPYVDNGDNISLYTLKQAIITAMGPYNEVLVKETSKLEKKLNRESFLYRMFKDDVPEIGNFIPGIEENGTKYIDVLLKSGEGKYAGFVTIDDKCNINTDYLRTEYSANKLSKLLCKYPSKYLDCFNKLSEFEDEYPNTKCEWNSSYENTKQLVDDGFLNAYFYLDTPNYAAVGFSNVEDYELSRIKSKKYGELFDYIDFYKDRLLLSMSVNINDLNDLFKKIVSKQLNIEKGPTLKRVK